MSDLLDVHQMRHRLDHSAHLGPIVAQRLIADPAQTQCSERVPLILLAARGAAHLADLELRHYELTACRARRIAAGVTSSTVLPRRLATSSGCSSPCSAATVACTTLIAFAEPRDLASTSCTPAHSSTARADPPAMTPVPGEAGRSRTTPAAFSPCTGCGIVPWIRGTVKKCFFASSTPLAIAAGTSLALPYPTPTVPSPSPTTTSAVKLNRRPPLTTLSTRLIATTRSTCGVFSCAPPRPPPSRRSRRSPPPAPPPRRCCPGIRRPFRSGWCSSEVQAVLAGRVGERRDAAVVLVAAPVEDDRADAGRLGPLGHQLADPLGGGGLVAVHLQAVRGGRGQRDAADVVDDLGVHVPGGAGHDETRARRGAADLLAQPHVPAQPRRAPLLRDRAPGCLGGRHCHLPVFPALRRMTSPW